MFWGVVAFLVSISMLCGADKTTLPAVDNLSFARVKALGSLQTDVFVVSRKHKLKASQFMVYWVTRSHQESGVRDVVASIVPVWCPLGARFVDVGANTGIYGLVAAKAGCRVSFFEPQPFCAQCIEAAVRLNHFEERATVHQLAISSATTNVSMPLLHDGCTNQHFSLSSAKRGHIQTTPGDAFWFDNIALMKVDVEGHELQVLESFAETFQRGAVGVVIVELNPRWWKARARKSTEDAVRSLTDMVRAADYEVAVSLRSLNSFRLPAEVEDLVRSIATQEEVVFTKCATLAKIHFTNTTDDDTQSLRAGKNPMKHACGAQH